MLIDTHCHLNDPDFQNALPDVIERARNAGVQFFIVPSYDMKSLPVTAALASRFPGEVFPAYGIHPWYLDETIDYQEVFRYLRNGNPVAVGEIGLDFAADMPAADKQREALAKQFDFAVQLDLPVIVHCRKAHGVLLDILAPYRGKIRGVIHSFSGSKDLMFRFIDLGFYISFSGSVTRENARKYHANAISVPADRLLLETDAPSIATRTTVASAVEPYHTVEIARMVSGLRGIAFEEVCRISTGNALKLFNIPFKEAT